VFTAERALADLRRARWCPARETLFLVPGAPEPE
jgi:hypothetical protein